MTLDFKKICRLCMERRVALLPLYPDGNSDPSFPAKIMNVVPILKLAVDDGFPNHICQRCAHLVNISHKFKVQCENTEIALRHYVETRARDEIKSSAESGDDRWDFVSVKCEYEEAIDFKAEFGEDSAGELSTNSDDKDKSFRSYPEIIFGEEVKKDMNLKLIPKKLSVINKNTKEIQSNKKNVTDKGGRSNQMKCKSKRKNNKNKRETSVNNYNSHENISVCEEDDLINKIRDIQEETNKLREGERIEKSNFRKKGERKGFLCQDCGKNFTYEQHLLLHRRTHTGEKPFACSVCGECFSVNSNLNKHMRTHTGEKPFLCTVCGNSFGRSDTLTKHMRSHTGEKPFHCAVCGNSFGRRSILTNHMRTHSGEKPYLCTECGQRFAQSYDLTKHMRAHTGEKPYSCTMCDMNFGQKTSLNKHMRIHIGVPAPCLDFSKGLLYKL